MHRPQLVLCELADASAAYGVESLSPFCLKVHRALRAARLPYERRHGKMPSEFKRENPLAQVPVLLVDGEPVADSTQILRRIETIAGALGGETDARARAEAWLWEDLADTSLNGIPRRGSLGGRSQLVGDLPSLLWRRSVVRAHPRRTATARAGVIGKARRAGRVARGGRRGCWTRFLVTLGDLEARAPKEEDSGSASDRVTVADVSLFGQLQSLRTRLTPWQSGAIEEHPTLLRWLDRVDAATGSDSAERSDSSASRKMRARSDGGRRHPRSRAHLPGAPTAGAS